MARARSRTPRGLATAAQGQVSGGVTPNANTARWRRHVARSSSRAKVKREGELSETQAKRYDEAFHGFVTYRLWRSLQRRATSLQIALEEPPSAKAAGDTVVFTHNTASNKIAVRDLVDQWNSAEMHAGASAWMQRRHRAVAALTPLIEKADWETLEGNEKL